MVMYWVVCACVRAVVHVCVWLGNIIMKLFLTPLLQQDPYPGLIPEHQNSQTRHLQSHSRLVLSLIPMGPLWIGNEAVSMPGGNDYYSLYHHMLKSGRVFAGFHDFLGRSFDQN